MKRALLLFAALAAFAGFGYTPVVYTNSFTRDGVTYVQRGALGTSDYVATNIDSSAVGNVKSVNSKTGDVVLAAKDVGAVPTDITEEVKVHLSEKLEIFPNNSTNGIRLSVSGINITAKIDTNVNVVGLSPETVGALPDDYDKLTNNASFKSAVKEVSPPVELPSKWALANVTNAAGGAVTAADVQGVSIGDFVPAWQAKAYAVGDVVLYNGKVYKALYEVPAVGQFIPMFWEEISNAQGMRIGLQDAYLAFGAAGTNTPTRKCVMIYDNGVGGYTLLDMENDELTYQFDSTHYVKFDWTQIRTRNGSGYSTILFSDIVKKSEDIKQITDSTDASKATTEVISPWYVKLFLQSNYLTAQSIQTDYLMKTNAETLYQPVGDYALVSWVMDWVQNTNKVTKTWNADFSQYISGDCGVYTSTTESRWYTTYQGTEYEFLPVQYTQSKWVCENYRGMYSYLQYEGDNEWTFNSGPLYRTLLGPEDSTTLTMDTPPYISMTKRNAGGGFAKSDDLVKASQLSGYVPTTRKINGQPLTNDLEISCMDYEAMTNTVNAVKEKFYDQPLQVEWTVRMVNGDMKLYATTNVNTSVLNN